MKESDYIAYLESTTELMSIRIAELEAALAICLKNLDSAVMVKEINGIQVARAAKVGEKSKPASALMIKYFKAYYEPEPEI